MVDRSVENLTRLMTRSAADRAAVRDGCWFDIQAARRVRKFFRKYLRHSKGQFAGKSFTLLRWQWREVVMPLFGWKRVDGTRRFRLAYIEVPKKQGKSTLCSGIALYLLLADNEPGAEVFSAAADRDQASIVFNEAKNMVESSADLSRHLTPIPSRKRIIHPASKSFYQVLSAEVHTKEGLNIHGLLFDELHAQPNRQLFDALRYGGAARRQPLLISITTAGFDKQSICWEQHDYAEKVRDGIIDDTAFFPYIRAADADDDWTKPETWRKANPSLGVTIKLEDFAQDCKEAKESPAKENSFRRYRLNQWTEQDVRWLPVDKWESAEIIDADSLVGRTCYAGLDLASTRDLTAFVLMFPLEDGSYAILPHFWLPEDAAAQRARRDRVPYDVWVKRGWIKTTEGDATDYQQVRADIDALGQKYGIRKIAVDRLFQGEETCHRLSDMGFDVEAFGQGFFSMAAPTKRFDELYHAGKFKHDGNPVMRWMIGNASVEFDSAKNMKPSKKKSTEKIDGVVSACMALGLCMANEGEPTGPLFYSG